MSCRIVVRPACRSDEPARAELVRRGMFSYQREAVVYFFFQELTLQGCILAGAILFIFCGASMQLCALVPLGAVLVVYIVVYLTHVDATDRRIQKLRHELTGFVAEYHGPLLAGEPPTLPVLIEDLQESSDQPAFRQVVGTVSVEERWGPGEAGWLSSLAVHPKWQRRGIGRALLRACEAEAIARGLASLDVNLSELQLAARALLTHMGWSSLGWFTGGYGARLQMARLAKELPHA
ncbi:hypothetical protein ACJJTC_014701 [Scirpophaga incertulas]